MAGLRVILRLMMMAALLIICVFGHYIWRLFGSRPIWPSIFLAGIGWIAGVELRITGTRSQGGVFLLANHVSWVDIPAISWASGAGFVANDGLAATALTRWFFGLNDTVFVARHDPASVAYQVEQVRKGLSEKGALAIFPEATTSDGSGLLKFKSSLLGALNPVPQGISVQPVLIDYGPDVAEIAWVGEESGPACFLRLLARAKPIAVTFHYLPPLSGDELKDRKTMASAAQQAIQARLSETQRVAL